MRPSRSFVAVLAAALAAPLLLTGSPAATADDKSWTSLFASGPYEGAGWTRCPEPITISIDTRQLKGTEVAKARKAIRIALRTWNAAKNVNFQFGGELPVKFDAATGVSRPADGVARDRWVYLTLVKRQGSKGPDPQVVGLAGPLRLDPSDRTILEASAAFEAQYVNRESLAEVALLFTHELGHVAGLGHSTSKADVMYPILGRQKRLGAGDIQGARAILKPCPAEAPATTPPAG